MDINSVIEELILFSNRVLKLNEPGRLEAIHDFERTFTANLPEDYKEFIKRFNGISLMGTIVYGIGEEAGALSLDKYYVIEHEEVGNPMYSYLIPFSPDGYGNHYCFDTRTMNDNLCNVVFWQHNYPYSEDDPPEITNRSFAAWLKEVVIDWTLEGHDYNGHSR